MPLYHWLISAGAAATAIYSLIRLYSAERRRVTDAAVRDTKTEERLVALAVRLDTAEKRLDAHSARDDQVLAAVHKLETQVATLTANIKELARRLDRVNGK